MFFSESVFDVDYQIVGDQLLCRYQECDEQIVPWGRGAGAWRTGGSDWLPCCPEIDIAFMEEIASTSRSARPLGPRQKSRIAACQFLLNALPLHVRDLVRRFPTAQWQLFMFLNDGGDAALDLLESVGSDVAHEPAVAAESSEQIRLRVIAMRVGFDSPGAAANHLVAKNEAVSRHNRAV